VNGKRIRNLSFAFTLFRELSRQLPTKSLANHQTTPIAYPSLIPPARFPCIPRVRAMPRRFHTREYSESEEIDTVLESATVLSRDASRVSMACLRGFEIDAVWRWNSRGISKAPLLCWAYSTIELDQICIFAVVSNEKHGGQLTSNIISLYKSRRVELIIARMYMIPAAQLISDKISKVDSTQRNIDDRNELSWCSCPRNATHGTRRVLGLARHRRRRYVRLDSTSFFQETSATRTTSRTWQVSTNNARNGGGEREGTPDVIRPVSI